MDSISPYQPPAAGPPPVPVSGATEPSAIKVFGILHLAMAGIGVLMGCWYFVVLVTGNPFLNPKTPGYEAQLAFQQELGWVSALTGGFQLLLAGLLIAAGVKMIRSRPDGVRWSNRYAWCSIATKMASIVVAVVFVLPATHRMVGEVVKTESGKTDNTTMTVVRFSSAIGTIATPVFSCLYPALALFFLSRPNVKAWCRRNSPDAA
ncbi:hypothetical protein [Luteolibacter marinus]|uniref:hypothetical protein n=1 Tax=Luteolibacter marinus TaxID=2776705 RepID=UPI001867FE0E|nr:hypothetical protein [Luteolibacter marinus]